MNVLIIGSGGREHALAWKIAQSPRLTKLWIAPGNPGAAQHGEIAPIPAEDKPALGSFAVQNKVDLAIIGPEGPLADGLSDDLRAAGIPVFGPSQAAAQIEASKAFAKAFMQRHQLPSARYAAFTDFASALAYLNKAEFQPTDLVIKASGLAAGKGVILPETAAEAEAALRALMLDRALGEAAREVIIEERLAGAEVSLLAFTDGVTVRPLPPAQDHKRLLDGDRGPNTGGMGAYAPAAVCPPALVDHCLRTILQPTVDGLRAEGRPFTGLLYAGLILTQEGPKILEFNCRFGDPETQALLPLLDSDLLEIARACALGGLDTVKCRWKPGAAACVVLASQGYPGKVILGHPISGLDQAPQRAVIFHAGTKRLPPGDGALVTAGGRVLGITGLGGDLPEALAAAYGAMERVDFEGKQFRRDIGAKGGRPPEQRGKETEREESQVSAAPESSLAPLQPAVPAQPSAYAQAGVSIDAGNRAVEMIKSAVRSTYGPEVLMGIGAFGGLYDAAGLQAMRHPVLVSSTDGVGTKVKLAAQAGRYRGIGQDIVNHCIDDILVQGARPLFFLDYFATSRLKPEVVAEVVAGIADACRQAGCALIGGETAEMPGVYQEGEFDLAGAIVGVVERQAILPRLDHIQAGDVLLGLASSGPHTNGYSLIRQVFTGVSLDQVYPELGLPLGEALLAPHRSYLSLLRDLLGQDQPIKALAHLTGGGFVENIPRVLPEGLGARLRLGSWPIPPLFRLIQQRGGISTEEMARVFNLGIGMVAVLSPEHAAPVQARIPETSWVVGEIVAGKKGVAWV